ncbi:NAD-dependent epimerase/dehydratase family protein [Halalkalibacterium halodurans]|uniref:UDP-glucose 4-epimerase n=1 Tax=Halalkalibacterium halodurans (strain ATCC BAA-125 / DSM 18197 / FERM 7344 / JCM 9153 / C-125) TaxID=272558 RepID=Q9K8W1_HALH5|nr:NAD(P)-dependent oxidoreductase [Halalkalibacterium halodurans]MDY7223444.1 NAD(P)-dependent oxidoreductase [Halalkalibacterium halodurans]MDY7242665.1 NAD(P)-dependent oxidoreductase [Halalkalibacterium halodurans]MED4171052.1 NAD(P)-dependent oxidoreductase [Halalkalibacterium halodurans]BAB06610.1 UDP-glucose 4-epimerase [Halalkalibacterium halodurans C-125]
MNRVLITGGLGFIGYHLCEALLGQGIDVTVIDHCNDEMRKEEYEEKQLRMGRNALFHFIECSLEHFELSTVTQQVDTIYHLAAHPKREQLWTRLPENQENTLRRIRALTAQAKEGTRLIFVSSVEVYGERSGTITEQSPTRPTSPYGIVKLAAEKLLQKEANKRGLDYMILRLPTIYGPWQRQDMTYQQLLLGRKEVKDDQSTLDALYISDAINGLLLAGKTKHTNETIQLSSGNVNEWQKGKAHLLNKSWNPSSTPLSPILSNEKAKQLLGFKVITPLKNGLEKQREHVTQWQRWKSFLH